jgi:hypothetical protein
MSNNTEKKFDKFFVANLRRTAQMVSPKVIEKQKLQKEVAEKQARIAVLDEQIESLDGHIRRECGYGVEALITRHVVETGKFDSAGRPIKVTKWELKYPETIVPPTEGQPVAETEETEQEPERPIE